MTAFGTVRMVGAGDDYSVLFVAPDGVVRCLGVNGAAELGNGSIDVKPDGGSLPAHTTGTLVSGLPPVDRLAARDGHTCAILAHPCASTGAPVMCWGTNSEGELGNGTSDSTQVAVSVRAP